jgi:hypothetical protein
MPHANPNPLLATGPLRWFLDLFSRIWLGVGLLTALFVYSSIGSIGLWLPRGPNLLSMEGWVQVHVRQLRGFEMTEFQWFHWWPFNLIIGLICLNVVVATLRRIPFRPVNYGVWMIHTGILVLSAGSLYYFATKREGDAPVIRRQVRIQVPGHEPAVLVALPGNRIQVGEGRDAWSFTIAGIDPDWELLSGEDAGARAYKVSVHAQHEGGQLIRELLAGYPQYTEDLVASGDPRQPMARARKVLGKPLVHEGLRMDLEPRVQAHFHLMDSSAIALRLAGSDAWVERPIDGLPIYNDYVAAHDDVWLAEGDRVPPLDPLDLEVGPRHAGDPLADVPLRVSRYLRYALMQSRRMPGGPTIDPMVSLRLTPAQGQAGEVSLRAFDPHQVTAAGGRVRFAWADSPQALEAMGVRQPPALHIAVVDAGVQVVEPVTVTRRQDAQVEFGRIGTTDYEYRVEALHDGMMLAEDQMSSVAVVEIRTPQRSYARFVFDDPGREPMDFRAGADLGDPEGQIETDANLRMVYRPGSPELVLASGPGEGDLWLLRPADGGAAPSPLARGESAALADGTRVEVLAFHPRTRLEARPAIVPEAQRIRDARVFFSMVCVDLPAGLVGPEPHSVWLPFNQYLPDDPQDALSRYPLRPTVVRLADGRALELAYGRQRRPLPRPVVLDDFNLLEHVGGYTGSTLTIRDWVSMVSFGAGDAWSEPRPVRVNQPVEDGGYWYFQAQWDPPDPERRSRGLNYTVLGVGNRNGVNIMLAGCCLAVAGMIYAFYVKPFIKRRTRRAAQQRRAEPAGPAAAPPREAARPQPIAAAIEEAAS